MGKGGAAGRQSRAGGGRETGTVRAREARGAVGREGGSAREEVRGAALVVGREERERRAAW